MAVGESAGSVYVTIDGDASPLMAKYAQAETASRAAGAKVASGFNAAANATNEATEAASTLAAGIGRVGQAAERTVPQMAAASGAVRAAFGEQSIRAVERLITLIPGVGAVLQTAFPLIGAIALIEMITRVVGKFGDAKQAAEQLATATKAADDALFNMGATLDNLNVEHVTDVFGAAAGKGAEKGVLEQKAKGIQLAIDDLYDSLLNVDTKAKDLKIGEEQLRNLKAQLLEVQGQIDRTAESQDRLNKQQSGSVSAQVSKNYEQSSLSAAALSKQRAMAEIDAVRQATKAQDDALTSAQARMVSEADAEVAAARAKEIEIRGDALATRDTKIEAINQVAAAEKQGKSRPEQQKIDLTAAGAVRGAQDEYQKTIEGAAQATSAAVIAQVAAYTTAAREEVKAQKDFNQEMEHTISLQSRWADLKSVSDKTDEDRFKEAQKGGLLTDPRLAGTDIQAALQASEKGGGRVPVTTQSQSASEKSDLEQQLSAVQKLGGLLQDELAIKQRILQIDIASATAAGKTDAADKLASANVALQQTLAQWRTLDIGNAAQALEQTIVKIPDELGSALANAIFAKPKKGESKGQEIEKGAVGVAQDAGKQLLSQLVSQGIKFIVGQITQTASAAAIAATQTAALIGAMTANTAAITTAIGIAAGIDTLAGGTDSAPGGMALVGEKGPEIMHVPRGAQIIPNHKIGKYADGIGYGSMSSHSSHTMHNTFHIYESRNGKQTAREVGNHIRSTGPGYTVFSK